MHADLLGAEVGAGAQVVQGPAALAPPRLRALLASAPDGEKLHAHPSLPRHNMTAEGQWSK